jgi:hypothetical protein
MTCVCSDENADEVLPALPHGIEALERLQGASSVSSIDMHLSPGVDGGIGALEAFLEDSGHASRGRLALVGIRGELCPALQNGDHLRPLVVPLEQILQGVEGLEVVRLDGQHVLIVRAGVLGRLEFAVIDRRHAQVQRHGGLDVAHAVQNVLVQLNEVVPLVAEPGQALELRAEPLVVLHLLEGLRQNDEGVVLALQLASRRRWPCA